MAWIWGSPCCAEGTQCLDSILQFWIPTILASIATSLPIIFPFFNRVWLDQERALREMSRSPVLLPMDDSSTANVSLLKLDLHNIGLVTKYQLLVYQFIWVLWLQSYRMMKNWAMLMNFVKLVLTMEVRGLNSTCMVRVISLLHLTVMGHVCFRRSKRTQVKLHSGG